ncbi:MAG TPA: NAD-dependent epimerase/dehydratase family protein [Pirellulales bacterium]
MKPKSRVLITGVSGFTGRWLVAQLRKGPPLHLAGLGRSADTGLNLDSYTACDVRRAGPLADAVARAQPEFVFHLAGCNAFHPAKEIEAVNVQGFEHLLAALVAIKPSRPIRLLTIGSAAELGRQGAAQLPVTEDAACEPESAYGRSKWSVTRRVLTCDVPFEVDVLVARTFNLAGPGLDRRLALGHFVEQIAAFQRGEIDALCCGRLDTRRDYVDVRDAVAAYAALVERGRPGQIYNVCSGSSHSLREILDTMLGLAGVRPTIVADGSQPRAGDLADVYGSLARLKGAIGWRPTTPLNQSLADMLAAGCQ